MVKPSIDWQAINRILDDPSEDFDCLAKRADLNPSTDFIGMDLRGIDFGWCDLSAYNFDQANVEGADLSNVVGEPKNLLGARNLRKARLPRPPSYQPLPDDFPEGLSHPEEPYVAGPAFALAEEATAFEHETKNDLPAPPRGWTWVDGTSLRYYSGDSLSDDDLVRFFNGGIPNWRVALSKRVPHRAVVSEAEGVLQAGAAEPQRRPAVVLLQGAGGEGKSTVFRQTIVQLLEKNPSWHVLWRDNDLHPLSADWVADLPEDGRPILIAADEADNIGRSLLAFVEMIRLADHDRFHFLLAARDTDWRGANPDDTKWRELTDFRSLTMRGINEADAEEIYDAWSSVGKHGLGLLDNMTRENAIRRLIATSKDNKVDRAEGPFLGAILELRYSEGFKDHVRKLLDRLKNREAPSGSLYDVYAYIAAMHTENLRFLSPPVLAAELGCTERDLRRNVMVPLADEACGLVQGGFILTRHRSIAKAAIEIMEEEGEDRWSLITKLAERAVKVSSDGYHVPQLSSWLFVITDRLVEREEFAKASTLIERILAIAPYDLFPLVKLVQIYRKTGNSRKAEQLFRDVASSILVGAVKDNAQRVFFREWSAAAGSSKDHTLAVWLAGVSLSDWHNLPRLDQEHVELALAVLGVACEALHALNSEGVFLIARDAIGQSGLKLVSPNDKSRKYFKSYRKDGEAAVIANKSLQQAVRAIEAAVQRAYGLCRDADELIELGVPYPPDEFGFSSLQDFMLAEQRRTRR